MTTKYEVAITAGVVWHILESDMKKPNISEHQPVSCKLVQQWS